MRRGPYGSTIQSLASMAHRDREALPVLADVLEIAGETYLAHVVMNRGDKRMSGGWMWATIEELARREER